MNHKFQSQLSQKNNLGTPQNPQSLRNLNKTLPSINSLTPNKIKRIKNNRSLIHQITKLRTSNPNPRQTNKLKTKPKKIHLQANTINSLNHPNNPIKNLQLPDQLIKQNLKFQMTKVDSLKEMMIEKRNFLKIQGTL